MTRKAARYEASLAARRSELVDPANWHASALAASAPPSSQVFAASKRLINISNDISARPISVYVMGLDANNAILESRTRYSYSTHCYCQGLFRRGGMANRNVWSIRSKLGL